MCYFIDLNLEILSFKKKSELEKNLEEVYNNLNSNKIPILIFTDSIYTLVGITANCNEFLVINHEYSGNYKFSFHITKSNACKWMKLDEIVSEGCRIEILIAHPNHTI